MCFRKFSYKENRVVDRKTMMPRKHFFPYFKWDGNFHVHLWLSIFPYFNGERKKCWCNLRKSTSLQPLQKSGWWGKLRNLVYKWKGLPSVRTWIIWKEINYHYSCLTSLLPKNPYLSTQHLEINIRIMFFFVLSKVNSNVFPCSETFWGKAPPIKPMAFWLLNTNVLTLVTLYN